MPRFPVHTIDDAPEASRAALEATRQRLGKVLNIYGEMAHAPVLLAVSNAMSQAVAEHGTFDARTREAIALAVGNQNGCGYCQSAHTLGAVRAGWSEEQTLAIRDGQLGFAPKLDALLMVARQIAANVGEVADETYEHARRAGWSDEELAELFAHVMVNMLTNYFNHYAETELDIPAASGLAS
ncbi:MAG: carboxymuconolactone decarboxylase family protein [Streptosporangiales bacterium]|nr:carboxymuconolactone decarboxylase family protein [Streptosporangiales bacterium]